MNKSEFYHRWQRDNYRGNPERPRMEFQDFCVFAVCLAVAVWAVWK